MKNPFAFLYGIGSQNKAPRMEAQLNWGFVIPGSR
jgi:hypothetical protein